MQHLRVLVKRKCLFKTRTGNPVAHAAGKFPQIQALTLRIQQPQELREPAPQVLCANQEGLRVRDARFNQTNARARRQRRKKIGGLFGLKNELMFKFQHGLRILQMGMGRCQGEEAVEVIA